MGDQLKCDWVIKMRANMQAPSKSMFEILKGLQRHERKRLSEELARIKIPGISNKAIKEMVRSGMIPKRFQQVQITRSLRSEIISLFSTGTSFLGSGINGILNQTGSNVSILLFQSMDE